MWTCIKLRLTFLDFLLTCTSSPCAFGSQESLRTDLAWGFQKNSELLPVFNHYIHQMQETGVLDKLRREIVGRQKNANSAKVLGAMMLGYEDLAIPFLVLLIGAGVAFIPLAIEAVKKCVDTKWHNPQSFATQLL